MPVKLIDKYATYGAEFAALFERLPAEGREKLIAVVQEAAGPVPLKLATFDELDPRRRKDPAFLQMLATEVRGRLIDERRRPAWQAGRHANRQLIADLEEDEIKIGAMLGIETAKQALRNAL